MKKTLREELERIHGITYGGKLTENLLDKILTKTKPSEGSKIDDPKKADFIDAEVDSFFKELESAKAKGGVSQQTYGSMEYQQDVEAVQIGLILLGYELPKHGVDGLFGPETAQAVSKFNADNAIINEAAEEIRQTIDQLGYAEKGSELTSGGEISDELSKIVAEVLRDYKQAQPKVKVTVTSGNDKFHKRVNYNSKHKDGNAVDITLTPYNSASSSALIKVLDNHKAKNPSFGYIDEYTNPSKASTGGHFHLQIGATKDNGGTGTVKATPETIELLIVKLKERGVKPEDLMRHIDTVKTGGAGFTDIDLTTSEGMRRYSGICQQFINSKNPQAGITGEMMANGALAALKRYGNYVPPELALAQLVIEGGLSKDPNAKPIRTNNPFNVGNTDSGKVSNFTSKQDGVNAYYNLIAKNYIGKGRTAANLINNFTNKNGSRYASDRNYESKLNALAGEVNKISGNVA
jgi:hypothetical protein